ncbi:hypothetical protein E2C01_061964 [Portunus trituberculatus]|uniref:Uncharacterized protein n=1 Tax=Portunus trituberculatus TaxID=210409 RepID=A0A5B7H6P0_PORTR|nr:hypothetical protein [Portunus trituberculatus]
MNNDSPGMRTNSRSVEICERESERAEKAHIFSSCSPRRGLINKGGELDKKKQKVPAPIASVRGGMSCFLGRGLLLPAGEDLLLPRRRSPVGGVNSKSNRRKREEPVAKLCPALKKNLHFCAPLSLVKMASIESPSSI